MDTPILDMIFSRPLFRALIRLPAALSSATPSSTPRRAMFWTVSTARYGSTAEAPKPMSRAMWWHSRASPDSTIRPTRVRVFSRIRWWWMAPVSSSEGIGASSGSGAVGSPLAAMPRSDSTSRRAPFRIASEASAEISVSRCRRASPPPATRYRPSIP